MVRPSPLLASAHASGSSMSLLIRPVAGQPGLFRRGGLGSLPTTDPLVRRIEAAHQRYVSLKADTQAILAHFPAPLQPTTFARFVERLVLLQSGAAEVDAIRLTASQLADLLKAALSTAGQNIGMAAAMAGAAPATARKNRAKIEKLVSSAENVVTAAQRLVTSLQVVQANTAAAQRASGLGMTGAEVALVFAGVIAGTVVLIVGAVLVYSLVSYVAAALDADAAARRQCELDEAAGTPCTGSTYATYRERALEDSRRFGMVPDIRGAVEGFADSVSDTIFWGGILVVGSVLAYGAWVSAPAARETRSFLTEEASSYRQRRARRRRRGAYR